MEEGIEGTKKENLKGDGGTTLQPPTSQVPSTEFVKVEKNLASLGFFTPSSKRARNEKAKTVSVTVVIDGKRIEAKATIAPTALFGLPITADQDKWLALHKIIADIQTRDGHVTNPVCFSSAELLALLKIYKDSGKNYRDVSDWLDVMVGTTIVSEGAVYVAGKRTFGKDTFHVFDRAVSFGKELPDGSIADKNYVWLSQWQLQNINDHHQLPIDLDTYRQLKNHIAKALVPLLQVWLYATRDDGVFEKRYDELCQILDVRQWTYPSKIKEKLGPSLDELKQFGYLADWRIESTTNQKGYKVLFFHGEKFHRDRRARLNRKQTTTNEGMLKDGSPSARISHENAEKVSTQPSPQNFNGHPVVDPELLAEFIRRGITERKAFEMISNLKLGHDIVARFEYYDSMIEHAGFKIVNPPGFYIRMIEKNLPVPDNFETSAQRKAKEEADAKERARRAAEDAREALELVYERYCAAETDAYITEHPDTFAAVKAIKLEDEKQRFSSSTWYAPIENIVLAAAKWEIRKQVPLLTFEEFIDQKKQGTEFSLKPVRPSPSPAAPDEPAAEATLDVERGASAVPDDLLAAEERREAEMNKAITAAEEPALELAKAESETVMPMEECAVAGIESEHDEANAVSVPQAEGEIESDKTSGVKAEPEIPAPIDSTMPISEPLATEVAPPSWEQQITDTFPDEEAAA